MAIVTVCPDIYWVGAVDRDIRYFHGRTYTIKNGTTYNAYLIKDDKITLVDTVYRPFAGELIDHIRQIVSPEKIDHIIINHIETDHVGALPDMMKMCPHARLFCTAKSKEVLDSLYHQSWDFTVVKTGDVLRTGRKTLRFVEAPMIHWPDSMFTYVEEDRLLLSNDAFGQHYASHERFDDQVERSIIMDEAVRYYANILWPFSVLIRKKLDEMLHLDINPRVIAPSHGLIWRTRVREAIDAYLTWSQNTSEPRVVILHESMWGGTEKMAHRIAQGLTDAGIEVIMHDVTRSDRTDIITDMFKCLGYCIGSSTHGNDMLPTMAGFLHLLKGLKPCNRIAGTFGTYGWTGGAAQSIETVLQSAGIRTVLPPCTIKYAPGQDGLAHCYEYGREFARVLTMERSKHEGAAHALPARSALV